MNTQKNINETIGINEIIRTCLKKWYYFAICIIVFAIIGGIYYKVSTPVWNIVAKVSLRHNESLLGNASSIAGSQSLLSAFGLGKSSDNIEDESLKMSSQGYIKNVVKNLELNKKYIQSEYLGLVKTDLYDYSPIVLSVDPAVADTITKQIRFALKIKENKTEIKVKAGKETIGKFEVISFPATLETPWGNFTLEKTAYYDSYDKPMNLNISCASYDYTTQIYRKDLFIDYEKRTSDLINLGFKSENTAFAKKVLNEVINIYNKEHDDDNKIVSDKTVDFINSRLVLTESLLAAADKEIKEFKDKYNLTEIEADVAYYLRASGELQVQSLEAGTQLSVANIILDFVRDEKNKYSLIPYNLTLADQNIASVLEKYNEELARRNELHKANAQSAMVRSLDDQIDMQRQNLFISLENIKKGLEIAWDNIKKKENEFSSKIGKVPTIEQNYVQLRRNQEIQQTVYVFLLEMREQTAVKGINLLPKLKIIDPPYVLNKKVSPRLLNIALIIFILGMGIP
ncbi:MAG: hypothetical protein LBG15_10450, partial [Dysgonamonadaceae bacterium]|nr:hypothetical protein [Dysgonamonadaceae bacterium]